MTMFEEESCNKSLLRDGGNGVQGQHENIYAQAFSVLAQGPGS